MRNKKLNLNLHLKETSRPSHRTICHESHISYIVIEITQLVILNFFVIIDIFHEYILVKKHCLNECSLSVHAWEQI